MKTKIFLDSADPLETKAALELLGELDGQTTNPTLVARNPEVQERITAGGRYTREELMREYRKMVEEVAAQIPEGYISIEVPADNSTMADEMICDAREMSLWTPRCHMKLPTNLAGIEAAHVLGKSGFNLNMTLLFSQQQAGAVYESTMDDIFGDVYISPFVGRLDDVGQNGLSLIANIQKMFIPGDGHVKVLMASVRDVETIIWGFDNNVDAITAPLKLWEEWVEMGKPKGLTIEQRDRLAARAEEIPYEAIDILKEVNSYEMSHELTEAGLKRFADDWNELIAAN